MLSFLPSLAPRDSHTLWYTSNHQSNDGFILGDASAHSAEHGSQHSLQNPNSQLLRRSQIARTPLAQLRADEQYMERRKQNVQNYGSSWMKPPGVFRSLHQMREEQRELEEHQEAMRREQLAQELAEAEAAEDLMIDDELEQARDLDDDVPEADDLQSAADDSEDELESDEDAPRIVAQRVSEEGYRNAIIRGDDFGAEGGLDPSEEDRSQMFEEEDVAHDDTLNMNADLDMDVDMDGDLDGSVPEGEISGYEHTDTEDELTSSDENSSDMS